jgi:hypothetical protein
MDFSCLNFQRGKVSAWGGELHSVLMQRVSFSPGGKR